MDEWGWMHGWMDGWVDEWMDGWMGGRGSLPLLSKGKPWEKEKKLRTDQTPVLPNFVFASCDGTTFSILNLGEVPAAAAKLWELPHWDLPALHR